MIYLAARLMMVCFLLAAVSPRTRFLVLACVVFIAIHVGTTVVVHVI